MNEFILYRHKRAIQPSFLEKCIKCDIYVATMTVMLCEKCIKGHCFVMNYSECRSTKSHKIGHPFTLGKWEFSNLLKIAIIIAIFIAKSLQIIIKLQSLQLPTAPAFNYVFK